MRALFIASICVAGPVWGQDLVANGDFQSGLDGWWATENLKMDMRNGQVCVDVPGGTSNPWDAIIGQDNVALVEGTGYAFSFATSGDPAGPVRALVQQNSAPWEAYAILTPAATPQVTEAALEFTAPVDFPTGQVVFQLGGNSEAWTFCLASVSLKGGIEITGYTPDTGSPVRVNQVGYLASGPKRATFVSNAPDQLIWTLRDESGADVSSGMTEPLAEDPSAGLPAHRVDFSSVTASGDGFILSVGGVDSVPFAISDDVFEPLLTDALRFFYPNRSGIEIDGNLVGEAYARPAGHVGIAPNQGDTAVGCQTSASSERAYGEPWTCDYELDVTGGWYDAGDHGKYVVTGGISVAQLLSAYERAPDLFTDGQLPIPEAGNGIPDILDEVRWEIDWMLKMIVPDGEPLAGMVYHKVQDVEWANLPSLPHHSDKVRQIHRPSTAATLSVSAITAQAARIWRDIDPDYAAELLAVSLMTLSAADANPPFFAQPEMRRTGGGPYDDVVDEFFWAVTELYLTTGEDKYLIDVMETLPAPQQVFGDAAFDWNRVAALPFLHLATKQSGMDAATRAELQKKVIDAAKRYIAAQSKTAFGQIYDPRTGSYDWGSNHFHLQNAIVVATAYDITGDPKYRDAVIEATDYIFGRNALNLSYVTGYGDRYAKNQHSRWFGNQLDPALPNPPIGTLAGGPNSSIQDPVAQRLLKGCKPQFCYVDDIESWSTNKIMVNWNASLAHIASFLVGY